VGVDGQGVAIPHVDLALDVAGAEAQDAALRLAPGRPGGRAIDDDLREHVRAVDDRAAGGLGRLRGVSGGHDRQSTDDQNCGACDARCDDAQACVSGNCTGAGD
jgi:hypothetical protein